MVENPAHFVGETLFRPVGMLAAQARRLHFARRPVKLLGQTQPSRAGHRAQRGELLGAGLLIRQHGLNMSQRNGPCKSGLSFIRAQAAVSNLPHLTNDRRRTKTFPDVDFEFV